MSIFENFKKIISQFQGSNEVSKEPEYQYPYQKPSAPTPRNYEELHQLDAAKNEQNIHTEISVDTDTYLDEPEYVELCTAEDDDVCPMCKQFSRKIFLKADAPKLPLCPSCSCDYLYYFKENLPPRARISHKEDFILPADCVSQFCEHQYEVFQKLDINKKIQMLEQDLEKLSEFMAPYIKAKFEAPCELACRDLLPELYMQIGEWDKAEQTIKLCIETQTYYPEDGSVALSEFESYREVAAKALSYISENPGCLQRNMYKILPYEGLKREQLKDFLRYSLQIRKEKYNSTNKLFINTDTIV